MNNFGFLLFDEFEDLDFFGPWEFIALWSKYFNGPSHVFTIYEKQSSVPSAKGLRLEADYNFQDCPPLQYLLIPGGMGIREQVNNPSIIEFIRKQAPNCNYLLSVCTGAFLLQAAGLLANKKATSHWASLDRLKAFNELEVVEKRFVNDGNTWTSAGVSAGIDMTLAFIANTAGDDVAGKIQLYAEYYPDGKVYPVENEKLPAYITKKISEN